MSESDDPLIFLAILRAQIERHDQLERTRRRKDGGKLREGLYETLEDIGRIEGALDSLKRLWHKDDDNYRKAMMQLSRLAWELRMKLREILR